MNEQRNFEGIQFEELRKEIDPKYNTVHDELSSCYYGKKPFRNKSDKTQEKIQELKNEGIELEV